MKGLIILNGNIDDLELLKQKGEESDFILSADGGSKYAFEAGLIPDLVMGDFDSISKRDLELIMKKNISIKEFPIKKDKTDSELCVDYMIEKGFENITIFGAIGSRMDHTLANIFLLDKIDKAGITGEIIDSFNSIILLKDEIKLARKEGSFISVIPITSNGATVSLRGFEYNLDNFKLEFGLTHGVSNRMVEEEGLIKVHEGKCLIISSQD